ncbi:hypothetical protein SAMN05421841_1703 [Chryseobacterium wanjuense]|jgi:hypothetical protein|uniref:MetA-pathway of phenol degradation n=1 Tax=Chryseobacterium wanjuense TaxID=356305 RepID=A0A1I0Q6X5_9FLAO|nr:hypothetical protein [Chryseobacterium wanjuense]SEW22666.1 hypothetical protein SAMN05421841_1703 [Chryseobacterium wanjuense]
MMTKKPLLSGLFALGLCLCTQSLTAQNTDSASVEPKYRPFDVSASIKNKHLWRGYIVADVPVLTASATVTTKDKNLQFGLWSGNGFNGEYKEFCYFLNYHIKNFDITLLDSFNYTGFSDAKIFDYNKSSTRHFIDVNLAYHFSEKFPLTVSLATVVQGRDTFIDSNGKLKNRFSHYAELDYKVYEEGDTNVHLYMGGAFSFVTHDTFYSSSPGIVNVGVTVNKKIHFGKYAVPVFVQGMWNPNHNKATLGLGVQLF